MSKKNIFKGIDSLFVVTNGGDIYGVYTTADLAVEASTEEVGLVIHVVPVEGVNTGIVTGTYVPPSAAVQEYWVEDYSDFDLAELNPHLKDSPYVVVPPEPEVVRDEHVSSRPKPPAAIPRTRPQTPKDKILAKLQSELGLEDEPEWEPEPYAPSTVPAAAPSGGLLQYSQQGEASGQVEVFMPA